MNYWLVKSEPDAFSIDDLARMGTSPWDGVRNYQARNFMKEMAVGDLVFFYHSSCQPTGIVGVAEVVRTAYPDFTAWDPESHYFDPKSSKENPRWEMVDVRFVEKWSEIVTLAQLKANPSLSEMRLLQRGNRLSVMPVEKSHWQEIFSMSGKKA